MSTRHSLAREIVEHAQRVSEHASRVSRFSDSVGRIGEVAYWSLAAAIVVVSCVLVFNALLHLDKRVGELEQRIQGLEQQ